MLISRGSCIQMEQELLHKLQQKGPSYLAKRQQSSRRYSFSRSGFSRWCPFPPQKIVLRFSVPEPVPASRSVPCGSPGIVPPFNLVVNKKASGLFRSLAMESMVFYSCFAASFFCYTPNTVFVSRMPAAVFMVCSIKDRIACWLYPLSDALTI